MSNPLSEAQAHLRIARPTDSISSLLSFYFDELGFEVKLTFGRHEGFDGVLLTFPLRRRRRRHQATTSNSLSMSLIVPGERQHKTTC